MLCAVTEGVVVSKMKRGRANTDLHKDIMPVYNKTCEVLTCLAQFVDVHRLPDSVVLLVSVPLLLFLLLSRSGLFSLLA